MHSHLEEYHIVMGRPHIDCVSCCEIGRYVNVCGCTVWLPPGMDECGRPEHGSPAAVTAVTPSTNSSSPQAALAQNSYTEWKRIRVVEEMGGGGGGGYLQPFAAKLKDKLHCYCKKYRFGQKAFCAIWVHFPHMILMLQVDNSSVTLRSTWSVSVINIVFPVTVYMSFLNFLIYLIVLFAPFIWTKYGSYRSQYCYHHPNNTAAFRYLLLHALVCLWNTLKYLDFLSDKL